MLNVSEMKQQKLILNKYMDKIENCIFSKKAPKVIYKELLKLKKQYDNDENAKTKLSDDAKGLISYFFDWNLDTYKTLSNIKPHPLKSFLKGMGSIHL